jgi:hypothetical protein
MRSVYVLQDFDNRRCGTNVELVCSAPRKEYVMAKNTGKDFRQGAVTGRTQFQRPDGHWQKRDERTGQVMEVKSGERPFKGVAKEPDGRDTPNA